MANSFRIDSPIMQVTQNLLLAPIISAEGLLKGMGPAELNAQAGKVCGAFKGLLNKYPFNLSSPTDATVADVNSVFRKPDGALWTFYDQSLQKLLTKQGSNYVAVPGGTVNLTPQFVNWFNTSAAFSEALYAAGAQDPRFTYSLKPVQTDGVLGLTVTIDGQTLTFAPPAAPAPHQFVWQGGGTHGATSTVKFGGPELGWADQAGLWAAFRFFNLAETWVPSGNSQVLEWVVRIGRGAPPVTVGGKPLTVKLELDMGATPPFFTKGYLARLGCALPAAK